MGSESLGDPVNRTIDAVVRQEFTPSYADIDGRLMTLDDSVKTEPGIAVTLLLQGLALPKDTEKVPLELISSFVDMCSHLIQVQISCALTIFIPFALLLFDI